MLITADYHTHTNYSDGFSPLKDVIFCAKKAGLQCVAVTDHGFCSIIKYMTDKKFLRQECKIRQLEQEYSIKILHGIEANILGDGTLDMTASQIEKTQILNVGFHRYLSPRVWLSTFKFMLVNGWGPKKIREKQRKSNTEIYLKILENYPVDTLCHLNHRCLVDVYEVCKKAKDKGVLVELNEKHIEALKSEIENVIKSDVDFVVGSDAHKAKQVGKLEKIEAFIEKYNIDKNKVYGINGKEIQTHSKSVCIK